MASSGINNDDKVDLMDIKGKNRISRSPNLTEAVSNHSTEIHDDSKMDDLRISSDKSMLQKKLSDNENVLVMKTKSYNEQVSRLQNQVIKLRATVERGEAVKQQLDYELLKVNKDLNHERRQALERESSLSEINKSLSDQVSKATTKCQELENSMQHLHFRLQEEQKKQQMLIEETDKVLNSLRAERDVIENDNHKLQQTVQDLQLQNENFLEKLATAEVRYSNQNQTLQRQADELKGITSRKESLTANLESAHRKIQNLEENIEAERAAHLESKFNSEVIQLRVRDLEGALETEKAIRNDANENIRGLQKKIKELEILKDEKDQQLSNLTNQLRSIKTEYSSNQETLLREVEEKQNIVQDLSRQLDRHHNNFLSLRDELTKTKRRQKELQEEYGSSTKALEELVLSFSIPPITSQIRESPTIKPSTAVSSIRLAFTNYQNRIDESQQQAGISILDFVLRITSIKLSYLKKEVEKLSTECESYKEMIWSRDHVVEKTKDALLSARNDLKTAREDLKENQNVINNLRIQLQQLHQNLSHESNLKEKLNDELMLTKEHYQKELEDRKQFLHTLNQRFTSNNPPTAALNSTENDVSWPELNIRIIEHIGNFLVQILEKACQDRDRALQKMHKTHEETLSKLLSSHTAKERKQQEEKTELDEHYNKMLLDLQNRLKDSQNQIREMGNEFRKLTSNKEERKKENSVLKKHFTELKAMNDALKISCSLLAGVLWPLQNRFADLITQRNVLTQLYTKAEESKYHLKSICDTLQQEMKDSAIIQANNDQNSWDLLPNKKRRNMFQLFRVGAIAVLAANRLVHLVRCSHFKFFTVPQIFNVGISSVYYGGYFNVPKARFQGIASQSPAKAMLNSVAATAWLTSPSLQMRLIKAASELQHYLTREKPDSYFSQDSELPYIAQSTFSKIIRAIEAEFSSLSTEKTEIEAAFMSKPLTFWLGRGFERYQKRTSVENQDIVALSEVIPDLRNKLLELTRRLHSAEIERRSLRIEVTKLQQEYFDNKKMREKTTELQKSLDELHLKYNESVPEAKFETIYKELQNALRRESEAQNLLKIQSQQMQDLEYQRTKYSQEQVVSEASITAKAKELFKIREDLERKDRSLYEVNQNFIRLENDHKSVLAELTKAEKLVKTSAKEREALLCYLKAVEAALEQSKQLAQSRNLGDANPYQYMLPKLILPSERLEAEGFKVGPEMLSCQSVVKAFMEAQQQVLSKVSALESELMPYKTHIGTLKSELTAACQRQVNDMAHTSHQSASHGMKGSREFREQPPTVATEELNNYNFIPLKRYQDTVANPGTTRE
ncbi:Coiled-coil domain-containing protein 171 [Trichoplax sp. H2]|nr:Coiled-coil domain-containing protein 171 [Trichoplax sp. H2]|eukprot:RDD41449.1 Coiled-coil domain-containing protein 171 [Trichoplax sp. H2]